MSEVRGKSFVLQKLQQRGIAWVELRHRLAGHPTGRLMLATAELAGVFDDGLEYVHPKAGRLVLAPDAASFVLSRANIDPDAPITAALFCDVQRVDGTPHPKCVRTVLKRLLARAAHRDEGFYVGARIDLRWLAPTLTSRPARPRPASAALANTLSRTLARRLDRDGHGLRHWSVRSGSAHHTFEFNQADPLGLCDALIAFRLLAASVAVEHGCALSWLPRASATDAPLRLGIRLAREGNDGRGWDDALSTDGLSTEARLFRERLRAESSALSLCFRCGVNGWNSEDPYEVAISGSERGGESVSLAIDGLDAAADPWLATALMLGLALADTTPAGGRDHVGPARVITARDSDLMRSILGEGLVQALVAAAMDELRSYAAHVSGFERANAPEA